MKKARLMKAWMSGGAVLLMAGQFSYATLVVSESFIVDTDGGTAASDEYAPGQIISGTNASPIRQGPDVLGMTGLWGRGDIVRNNPTALWQVETGPETGGLDHSLIESKGGSVAFENLNFTRPDQRTIARALDATAKSTLGGSSSIYMSALLQMNDPQGASLLTGSGVFVGLLEDRDEKTRRVSGGRLRQSQGFKIGFVNVLDPTSGAVNTNLVYRSRSGPTSGDILQTNFVLDQAIAGETYLVVVRVDKNALSGAAAVNGNDRVRIWINPTDISSEAAAGVADFTLNDQSIQNAAAFNFLSLRGGPFGGQGVNFDEIMVATSWEDVLKPRPQTPPTGEIPEPVSSVLSLIGLGAVGMRVGGRRARQ